MSSAQRSDWEQGYADGLVEGQRLKDSAVIAVLAREVPAAWLRGREQGQRDERKRIRAAVEAIPWKVDETEFSLGRADALGRALAAIGGEGSE
jgi:hypothetical protein